MSVCIEHLSDSAPRPATRPITARVLQLINGEHYSGAERVQDLLALRLGEHGFAADFACLKLDRFDRCRQAQSAELYDVRMQSRFDLRPVRELARLIQDNNYQLLHTHTPRAVLVGAAAAALARVPLVHHLHSPTAADSTHRLRNWFNVGIERLSLSRVAAVIAVSHSLGTYALGQNIPTDRVHVVPNGVPPLGPLTDRPLPHGTWTLGTVALFRPRKGLETLIDALSLLRGAGLPVRLRAVGSFETEDYQQQIRGQVDHLRLGDAVEFTGFTQNVPAELARFDLFALPSLFGEGLPMVVLESMAAGVPIVATQVEGIPEALRHALDGLVVPPGDPQALADAVARFIRREVDWQAIRHSAHARQAGLFSDSSMAAGVAQVYQQVLAT